MARAGEGTQYALRREEIIQVAAELFREKGYRNSTLEEVAGRLGVTRPALYHYIRSKEELLSEIYSRVMSRLLGQVEEILARGLDPVATLRAIVVGHVEFVIRNRAIVTVFFQEKGSLPEEQYRRIADQKRRYDALVQAVVERGQRAGLLRPLDAKLTVYAIMGMANWPYQWFHLEGPVAPRALGDLCADLVLAGLLSEQGREAEESPAGAAAAGGGRAGQAASGRDGRR
ncbi:MAG: TetR/AcrR family transcriptional regulator [Bacillota bacterium]|nr:TetR/AcrR family transcriptional regulator [Bacillota bacterium]